MAINKTLSPKQISTNPVSSGFNTFDPWPFIYASKWGIKGWNWFPHWTFASQPELSFELLEIKTTVKQPEGLFHEAWYAKPLGSVTELWAPSNGAVVEGPS